MKVGNFTITTLTENPALRAQTYEAFKQSWDEFMLHDEVAIRHKEALAARASDFQFFILGSDDNVLAICKSVPIFWDGTLPGLPSGYDTALTSAIQNLSQNKPANTLLGLSVTIPPEHRNKGVSLIGLETMRLIGKQHGFSRVLIPVRPSLKHKYPLADMDNYITWTTSQGAPFDPWLRTHLKVGGKLLKTCRQSMTIRGRVSDWETWTKMEFPETGKYVVEGALVPIDINRENDEGLYYEPNVWTAHNL